MVIALTGATGNLGRLVVSELLDRGVPASEIVAIVRDPGKAAGLAKLGVVVREADYSDPAGWADALRDVERLLLISVSGPGASAAHRTVIDAAAQAGVGFVAYTSIVNADRSSNPLAPEHLATERLIEASGLRHALLRNAWYHEVYTRLVGDMVDSGELVASTGDGRVSGAARADFAAAAAAVLVDGEAGVYELGGDDFTLADFVAAVERESGRSVALRNLSDTEHAAHLQEAGMGGAAQFAVGVDASIRAGEMQTDSALLRRLLGRPLRSLEESVRLAL